ncbi:hypothetical protein CH375_08575 [Leptospira ellisii]|uniref:Uncharacterized protein n=1 Tax=Leptospira ellisii TaxID=2023197 RepID=A0A2N0BLG2_9LEPT|nr:hypothetical protein CH379_11110 [Leptospira ellisii]PKA04849.1 hypothetical protein CH375_08575 [Leptospira ellisii]
MRFIENSFSKPKCAGTPLHPAPSSFRNIGDSFDLWELTRDVGSVPVPASVLTNLILSDRTDFILNERAKVSILWIEFVSRRF